MARLYALDGYREHLADSLDELLIDQIALGFAQALKHYLLSRLRRDAPRAPRHALGCDDLIQMRVGVFRARFYERDLGYLVDHLFDDGLEDVGGNLSAAGVQLDGYVLSASFRILAVR